MEPVVLTITGIRAVGQDTEKIHITTQGVLERTDDAVRLSYTDGQEDWFGDNVISIEGDAVYMYRRGDAESQLVFEQDKTYSTSLGTPFGELDFSVYTTQLQSDVGQDGGNLHVEYIVGYGGNHILNRLQVNYARDAVEGGNYEN